MAMEPSQSQRDVSDGLPRRVLIEQVSNQWFRLAGYFAIVLFVAIVLTLLAHSSDILMSFSVTDLLLSTNWDPAQDAFGFLPAVIGTLYVTGIAMLLGTPLALLTGIYLAEMANGRLKAVTAAFIDVLAAVPGVVFGIVGLLIVVPIISDSLAPAVGASSTGLSILAAGLVMAIVVTPFMISLIVESIDALPRELRDATLSLGTTRWEMIKHVLLRAAGPGIFSAILLGFGRVFGATIVPTMLIGSQMQIPVTPFDPGQTLTSTIVNDFGELMSLPLTQSALIFVGLVLMLVVGMFNLVAMVLRRRLKRRWQY